MFVGSFARCVFTPSVVTELSLQQPHSHRTQFHAQLHNLIVRILPIQDIQNTNCPIRFFKSYVFIFLLGLGSEFWQYMVQSSYSVFSMP